MFSRTVDVGVVAHLWFILYHRQRGLLRALLYPWNVSHRTKLTSQRVSLDIEEFYFIPACANVCVQMCINVAFLIVTPSLFKCKRLRVASPTLYKLRETLFDMMKSAFAVTVILTS